MKKQLLPVFSFEIKRLRYNKNFFWVVVAVFVVVLFAAVITFFAQGNTASFKDNPLYDKEATLAHYRQLISQNDQRLLNPNLTENERTNLIKENAYYNFFLQSSTTEYDYLSAGNPVLAVEGQEGVGFAFLLQVFFYFFLPVLSVAVTVYIFAVDYRGPTLKNIFAAPISKKAVFKQRTLFVLTVLGIAAAPVFLISIVSVLTSASSNFIVYYGGAYYALNCVVALLAKFAGLFVLTLLFATITCLACVLTQSIAYSASSVPALYVLVLMVSLLVQQQFEMQQKSNEFANFLRWIPFLNVQQYAEFGFVPFFLLLLFVHGAVTAGLYLFTRRSFVRQDL